jgi:hypothetical protein
VLLLFAFVRHYIASLLPRVMAAISRAKLKQHKEDIDTTVIKVV